MLLDLRDLSGDGWAEFAHRSYRTGKEGVKNERRQRAKQVGAFTGLKTFWNSEAQRNVAIKITPMASVADAEREAPIWGLHFMIQAKSEGTVADEIQVDDVEVPHCPGAIITERTISGPAGTTSMRTVRANVDRVIFVVGCGAQDEFWPWDEVLNVVDKQVAKIQHALTVN
jgi:hypothetical protein